MRALPSAVSAVQPGSTYVVCRSVFFGNFSEVGEFTDTLPTPFRRITRGPTLYKCHPYLPTLPQLQLFVFSSFCIPSIPVQYRTIPYPQFTHTIDTDTLPTPYPYLPSSKQPFNFSSFCNSSKLLFSLSPWLSAIAHLECHKVHFKTAQLII